MPVRPRPHHARAHHACTRRHTSTHRIPTTHLTRPVLSPCYRCFRAVVVGSPVVQGSQLLDIRWTGHKLSTADELYHTTWEAVKLSFTVPINSRILLGI